MKHYFKVTNLPEENYSRKRKSFFGSWFSNLGVTGWLIIFNVAFFVLANIAILVFGDPEGFFDLTAVSAENLFSNGYWWTPLTSMFMHAGMFHLFVNMLSLFFIGKFLETLIGKRRFFWLYIISGIFAGLFFAVFSYMLGSSVLGAKIFGSPETLAVGASGAIFAIAGVLALLTPKNRVYLIAGPLIAIIIQAVIEAMIAPSAIVNALSIVITAYIFLALFAMFSFNSGLRKLALPIEMPFWMLPLAAIIPLVIIGLFIALPIGNMAHLGGFIAGAVYGIYLRVKYKRKTRIISEYFSK